MNIKLRCNSRPRENQFADVDKVSSRSDPGPGRLDGAPGNDFCELFAAAKGVLSLLTILLMVATVLGDENRVMFVPHLQVGQVLRYDVHMRETKTVKAKVWNSHFRAPKAASIEAYGLLKVEILDVQPSANGETIQLRTTFETFTSNTAIRVPNTEKGQTGEQQLPKKNLTIVAAILADRAVTDVQGLAEMLPEQQRLWREWMSNFTLYAQVPRLGMKRGDGWPSEQPELAPADLGGLFWDGKSTYVGDESCRGSSLTLNGEAVPSSLPPERCGAFVLRAKLQQKPSSVDVTPDAFKLRELTTYGTAQGKKETRVYLTRKIGCLMNASSKAERHLDVHVRAVNGSDQGRYKVVVRTYTSAFLVWESLLTEVH